jgi:hypothetical protein
VAHRLPSSSIDDGGCDLRYKIFSTLLFRSLVPMIHIRAVDWDEMSLLGKN